MLKRKIVMAVLLFLFSMVIVYSLSKTDIKADYDHEWRTCYYGIYCKSCGPNACFVRARCWVIVGEPCPYVECGDFLPGNCYVDSLLGCGCDFPPPGK